MPRLGGAYCFRRVRSQRKSVDWGTMGPALGGAYECYAHISSYRMYFALCVRVLIQSLDSKRSTWVLCVGNGVGSPYTGADPDGEIRVSTPPVECSYAKSHLKRPVLAAGVSRILLSFFVFFLSASRPSSRPYILTPYNYSQ